MTFIVKQTFLSTIIVKPYIQAFQYRRPYLYLVVSACIGFSTVTSATLFCIEFPPCAFLCTVCVPVCLYFGSVSSLSHDLSLT